MKAILIDQPGGPGCLYVGIRPTPTPRDDELLVRVAATALNRADLMQREGRYPPPPGASDILGLEIAGTVEAVGAACEGWAVGEHVMGLLPGGGYAEYAVLPHQMAMPVPAGMPFEAAAAIPEVFLTAFQALYGLGGLDAGQQVLIHAGASGVGTAAIQLARHAGARAYVTASASKHERCLDLGAALAINYKEEDFADRVLDETAGRGVDIILDCIGAPYFEQNIRVLATDGRLILLAMMGGRTVEAVDLGALFRKRARVITTSLRSRSLAYKIALTQDFAGAILPAFDDGRVRPVLDTVFAWTDVQAAHRYMEANKNVGKIVLRITEET
jgi:putative PIG3 family NAD(P)H quinone oxidoreductase